MSLTLNFSGLRITDALRGALTTSGAAYDAAASNMAVPITAAEYAAIQTAIGGTLYGAMGANLTTSATSNVGTAKMIIGVATATGTNVMPVAGKYYPAFCFKTGAGNTIPAGVQLGAATTTTGNATALSLISAATANADALGLAYYVVKAPTIPAPGPYLVILKPVTTTALQYNPGSTGSAEYLPSPTDVTSGPLSVGFAWVPAIQFIGTSSKQW